VIVNEFGEIGIDNDLIVESDEEIYEMNNGCVCCTVRGDLMRVVEGLMRNRGASTPSWWRRPGSPIPRRWRRPSSWMTTCATRRGSTLSWRWSIAKHVPQRLKDSREAEDQIAFADVMLLNKTDLVTEEELHALEHRSERSIRMPASTASARQSSFRRFSTAAPSTCSGVLSDPHFLEEHEHPDHACGPDCDHDTTIITTITMTGTITRTDMITGTRMTDDDPVGVVATAARWTRRNSCRGSRRSPSSTGRTSCG
jgi:hypothetical protein